MSASEAARPTRAIEQLRLPTLLLLFLVPGALMTVVYVLIAPLVESAGFPPIAALLIAIVVVLLPIELGVVLRAGLGQPQRIRSVVPYRRPLAAQAYYLLGDYQATLRQLQDFEPEALYTGGFDSRWGMLGRVRLLRAAAFEQLGRRAEARQEYQQVLSQWRMADASLQPFVRQAQQGLARLGDAG